MPLIPSRAASAHRHGASSLGCHTLIEFRDIRVAAVELSQE